MKRISFVLLLAGCFPPSQGPMANLRAPQASADTDALLPDVVDRFRSLRGYTVQYAHSTEPAWHVRRNRHTGLPRDRYAFVMVAYHDGSPVPHTAPCAVELVTLTQDYLVESGAWGPSQLAGGFDVSAIGGDGARAALWRRVDCGEMEQVKAMLRTSRIGWVGDAA